MDSRVTGINDRPLHRSEACKMEEKEEEEEEEEEAEEEAEYKEVQRKNRQQKSYWN